MIVVDTNVIAYLFINGEYTANAKRLLRKEQLWLSSILWRSEFRNILFLYMRERNLLLEQAFWIMSEAEQLMLGNEYDVNSEEVLKLAHKTICSAYDCEFIVLAQNKNCKLYTSDKKILKEFPEFAFSLNDV